MRFSSTIFFLRATCVIVFFIAFSVSAFAADVGYTSLPGGTGTLKMLEPGQKALDFTAENLAGDEVKFSEITKGKVVFLLFWSVFCQPCQEEMPVIKEFADGISKDDLIIVAVSVDGDKRRRMIRPFKKRHEYNFTFLMDVFDENVNDFIASNIYGVLGTPTVFMIDKDGVIVYSHTGKATLDELKKRYKDATPGA